MTVVEESIVIDVPREDVFEISQDYAIRKDWDAFTVKERILDGANAPGKGVRTWVKSGTGLSMTLRYVTFARPERIGMRREKGGLVFKNYSMTWTFEETEGKTRVRFRYVFDIKPMFGGSMQEKIERRIKRETYKKLQGLKEYCESRTQHAKSPVRLALADSWQTLPKTLQEHHGAMHENTPRLAYGKWNVSFPGWMKPFVFVLKMLGALPTRRGTSLQSEIIRTMHKGIQQMRRTLRYIDDEQVCVPSEFVHYGNDEIIEFANHRFGVRMRVRVDEKKRLCYEGLSYILKVNTKLYRFPNWLGPGRWEMVESAKDNQHVAVRLRVIHPLLGEIYSHAGEVDARPSQQRKSFFY